MAKQFDQRGEVMMQDGVCYEPGNVPCTTVALCKGKAMKDVASATRHGDTVEVVQFCRNANREFFVDLQSPHEVARRTTLIAARHFKLKYGIERKHAQKAKDNCDTMEALSQVERQSAW